MKSSKQIIAWWLIAAALVGVWRGESLAEGAARQGGSTLRWEALSFEASRWLNRVSTQVRVRSVAAGAALSGAVASDRGEPLTAQTDLLKLIDVLTTIDPAAGGSVQLQSTFWFDPVGENVLFGESVRTGQEEYYRRYRFTRQGVFRFRREPGSRQEASLPAQQWSDAKSSFYDYDPKRWECRQVADPSALIYLISAAYPDAGGLSVCRCVFHKRHLYRVCVQQLGEQVLDMNYTAVTGGRSVRRTGAVRTVKLALTAAPLGNYQGEVEDFSFLGFKQNIELYFDPAAGLPLMISGIIPPIGQAQLKLSEARLAD